MKHNYKTGNGFIDTVNGRGSCRGGFCVPTRLRAAQSPAPLLALRVLALTEKCACRGVGGTTDSWKSNPVFHLHLLHSWRYVPAGSCELINIILRNGVSLKGIT